MPQAICYPNADASNVANAIANVSTYTQILPYYERSPTEDDERTLHVHRVILPAVAALLSLPDARKYSHNLFMKEGRVSGTP